MGPCSSEDRRVLDLSSVTHSTGNQRSNRTGECRKEVEPSIVKTVKARTHVGFFKLAFTYPYNDDECTLTCTYNTYTYFTSSFSLCRTSLLISLLLLSIILILEIRFDSERSRTIDRRLNAKAKKIMRSNDLRCMLRACQ